MAIAVDLRRSLVVITVGLTAASAGLVVGITVERVRLDDVRTAFLEPEQDALQKRNRGLMAIELQTNGRHEVFQRQWQAQLDRIDEAMLLGDLPSAVATWRSAYAAAMQHGQWRDAIDVGDAAVRIGDVPDFGERAQAAARRSYLTGLQRALAQRSLEGVLRAAEAFATLGDRAVSENCVVLANRIAGDDADARRRVRAFAERFVMPQMTLGAAWKR